MTDIAPTLAALLGTSIPASNQGHVLIDMLTLPSERNVSIQNALIIQQTQLLKVYAKAIGSSINVGDGEIVSATETALKQAIQARLSSERIWRNMLAAFLAILPGYILFVRKDRKALWLMAGAILYVVLFNLRYAFIDGRTYSLASIEGANWLIIYTGTTAFVAGLIAWVVPMIGLRAFAAGSHKTIVTTLGYIWFVMYLLALPILLSFAINGLSVTWTLPEWNTIFIGLLSLIQWLFVALAGLFLIGILAVQGQLNRKHA
jgi:hypothetical protein